MFCTDTKKYHVIITHTHTHTHTFFIFIAFVLKNHGVRVRSANNIIRPRIEIRRTSRRPRNYGGNTARFRKKSLIETLARSPASWPILIDCICIWLYIRHRKALPLLTFKLLEKLVRVGLRYKSREEDIYFPAWLWCHSKNVRHIRFI